MYRESEQRRDLDLLRKLQKSAADDGNDRAFEGSFARISKAYIQDAAPALGKYELGFQLLDRDPDGEKAVGMRVFKLGSARGPDDDQILYAPVFFIKGDVKGTELLYLKGQDAFVPLKQNYVDYILRKQSADPGRLVNRQMNLSGVRAPDMTQIYRSPLRKMAHWDPRQWLAHRQLPHGRIPLPEMLGGIRMIVDTLDTNPWTEQGREKLASAGRQLDLVDIVERGGEPALASLLDICEKVPAAAARLGQYYGDRFSKIAFRPEPAPLDIEPLARRILREQQREKRAQAAATRQPRLEFLQYERGKPLPLDLTEDEAFRLRRDGFLCRDDRPDEACGTIKKADYHDLCNPDESGIWDIRMRPGLFERCYVVIGATGPKGRTPQATLVFLEREGKPWINVHPSRIWGNMRLADETRKFVDDLPTIDTLPDPRGPEDRDSALPGDDDSALPGDDDWIERLEEQANYILLHPDGTTGTYPISISSKFLARGPHRMLQVRCNCTSMYGGYPQRWDGLTAPGTAAREKVRPDNTYTTYQGDALAPGANCCGPHGPMSDLLELGAGSGTMLVGKDGEIRAGAGIKILKVRPGLGDHSEGDTQIVFGDSGDMMRRDPIELGNGIIERILVSSDGSTRLGDVKGTEKEAHEVLVRECGLRSADVLEVFRLAKEAGGPIDVIIKRGQQIEGRREVSPNIDEEPNRTQVFAFGDSYDAEMPRRYTTREAPQGPRGEDAYDPNLRPRHDPYTLKSVQEAAESGDRDHFEAAVFRAMLRGGDMTLKVDRYVPDYFLGNDRKGRILFCMYWHNDEFTNRYGRDGCIELEDGMRSSYDTDGDMILRLKDRGQDSDPESKRRNPASERLF